MQEVRNQKQEAKEARTQTSEARNGEVSHGGSQTMKSRSERRKN